MGAMSSLPIPDFAPRHGAAGRPRGWCAGVEQAVDIVEVALATYGPPVYVRKQIVHNLHVVRDLETRGAVFVDEARRGARGPRWCSSARRLPGSARRGQGEG